MRFLAAALLMGFALPAAAKLPTRGKCTDLRRSLSVDGEFQLFLQGHIKSVEFQGPKVVSFSRGDHRGWLIFHGVAVGQTTVLVTTKEFAPVTVRIGVHESNVPKAAQAEISKHFQVDEQRDFLIAGEIDHVQGVDKTVLDGVVLDDQHVRAKGIGVGHGEAIVWLKDGTRVNLAIEVEPFDADAMYRRARLEIEGVDGVSLLRVSDRIYLRGFPAGSEGREHVKRLVDRFPEIRELTTTENIIVPGFPKKKQ